MTRWCPSTRMGRGRFQMHRMGSARPRLISRFRPSSSSAKICFCVGTKSAMGTRRRSMSTWMLYSVSSVSFSFSSLLGVTRSMWERMMSLVLMMPTMRPESSTTGSSLMPMRNRTRAQSSRSMSGWATTVPLAMMSRMRASGFRMLRSSSFGVRKNTTFFSSATGRPTCPSRTTRSTASRTVTSGWMLMTSLVM